MSKGHPILNCLGGEGGIRTLGRFDPTPDYESGTFDHSATSPNRSAIIALVLVTVAGLI